MGSIPIPRDLPNDYTEQKVEAVMEDRQKLEDLIAEVEKIDGHLKIYVPMVTPDRRVCIFVTTYPSPYTSRTVAIGYGRMLPEAIADTMGKIAAHLEPEWEGNHDPDTMRHVMRYRALLNEALPYLETAAARSDTERTPFEIYKSIRKALGMPDV